MTSLLTDHDARDRICTETGSTLFVEAGAGSGKTHSLVERITTLVMHDGVRLHDLAAVTFTEKAGAELRDRLRSAFEKQERDPSAASAARVRAHEALDDLDSAAIGTLHSFAQRILTMHPIEAGLPPMVEVLDEVASSVAFEDRWQQMRQELLDDESMSDTLMLALSAGVKFDHLRSLARTLGDDWDLIDSHILAHGVPARRIPDVAHLADRAARLAARATECSDVEDKFLVRLHALADWAAQLSRATDDAERLSALIDANSLTFSYGRSASWGGKLPEIKASCQELKDDAIATKNDIVETLLRPLVHWLATRVVAAAHDRAAEGRLEFHDLLVLARELLRSSPDVRGSLQQRFRRILLDEFQDTDPIQIELATRIAGGRDAGAQDWRDVEVPPGALFVVGDPQQSIYRFRRASIELYLDARESYDDASHVELSTNFRSTRPILEWVNAVFGELIHPIAGIQPEYRPLEYARAAVTVGPAVTVLGQYPHALKEHGNADEIRRREAADVAKVITRAIRERWTVVPGGRDRKERPIERADIAILIPARTSLPALEDALDDADILYRTESSSLVYHAQEIRDLLAAARAIADPSDQLACLTALRSPLFGCGDDDLWTWRRAGGSFHVLAPIDPDHADHPVGQALDYLGRLHLRARWMSPSEVLTALITDRRMFEVAHHGPRTRDRWRRLRFVVDQARAWSEAEHGGLRAYLAWVGKQGEESSRVAEAVLPEQDVDAVRIMTVHGAKGLEFPMVVLSGMTARPYRASGVQLLWRKEGHYAARLTKNLQTNDFNHVQPIEEQMDDHERRRLLYVAATRARDHLVVSLHRGQGGTETSARILTEAGADTAAGATPLASDDTATDGVGSLAAAEGTTPDGPIDQDAWRLWIESIREASRKLSAFSASGLEGTEPEIVLDESQASGSAKGPRDLELPPWSKGRYGDAIGRAVHGALQVVDLATRERADEIVAAQCAAEGLIDQQCEIVASLVRAALDSDLVEHAAVRPHWRESYVGTVEIDGTILEGFVDLIYRDDAGSLVVVDYKTDAVPGAALPSRVQYYRPQIDAYVRALSAATGSDVRGTLLFLAPRGVTAITVLP